MAAPTGNKFGANRKRWQHAIERALARAGGSIDKGLDPIADKLVIAAQKGDMDARREIGDRLDGRPNQSISAEIDTSVTVQVVKYSDGNTTPK